MNRTWTIVLIILFILLLGGAAFLLLRYQKKINDKEADLETANEDMEKSAGLAKLYQDIADDLRAGKLSAEEAKQKMDKAEGKTDTETTTGALLAKASKESLAAKASTQATLKVAKN